MPQNEQSIKILCLDLGGIVVDVSWIETIKELGLSMDLKEAQKHIAYWNEFHAFERGQISPQEFYECFIGKFSLQMKSKITYDQFVRAWNACLIKTLPGVEELLDQMALKNIPLYALSNTNVLHINHVINWPVFRHFKRILASQDLGARKPEPLIYEKALAIINEETGARAHEILFVDDLSENLMAAQKMDIVAEQSIYNTETLAAIFKKYALI